MAGLDNLGDVVYEEVYLAAKKLSVSQSISGDLARMVDEGVKRRCGGDRVYVPAPSREIRDMRICNAKMNGEPVCDIAKREGVSKSTVYDICARLGF